MTRAVTLAEIADSNTFVVDATNNRVGIVSTTPTTTLDVGGAVKATSFTGNVTGNATGLTGTPDIAVRNITGVAATFTGVLTYEDVTNIDSVGIITAQSDVSIADKIIHTGDTNTAIRFPAADTFTVETAGTERMRIEHSGRVGINQSSPIAILHAKSGANDGTLVSTFEGATNNKLNIRFDTFGPVLDVTAGDPLVFEIGGNERMRIDSSGNVGIGTNSPAAKLHISDNTGRLRFTNASGEGTAGVDYYANATERGFTRMDFSSGALALGTIPAWPMTFTTNNTERMRIDSSGRLILGATSSTVLSTFALSSTNAYSSTGNISNDNVGLKLLNTNGSDGTGANNYTGIQFNVASGATSSGSLAYVRTADNQGAFVFNQRTGASSYAEAMRIDSSGRLLVGTTSARTLLSQSMGIQIETTDYPACGLSIVNNQNADANPLLLIGKSRGATLNSNTIVQSGDTLGEIQFLGADGSAMLRAANIRCLVDGTPGANDMPGRLVFSTTADGASSPTEHMRINNVGETRCFSNNNTSTIELRNASSSGTAARLLYGLHSATDNTNGTAIYSIFTNGTTGTPSDIRLKKNVESTRDGYLEDVANLRVVKYHWKTQDDSEPKELGLIAQEVEQVFPGLIRTEGEGENETKELKRSVIPFILLKALQEANEKIEAQQQLIEDLLARVTALEAS
jgi:hypothetical protein